MAEQKKTEPPQFPDDPVRFLPFIYMKLHFNGTANRRITNIEPQNVEGWIRSAQSFINDKIPSFDIRYSLFDIRFLEFLLSIKPAVVLAGGWADT